MFKTKNDLSETTRSKLVELLNARLADAIDLQTQTKQAHWNVKGPDFIAFARALRQSELGHRGLRRHDRRASRAAGRGRGGDGAQRGKALDSSRVQRQG